MTMTRVAGRPWAGRARIGLQRLAALLVILVVAISLLAFIGWRDELTHAPEHEVIFIIPKGTAILQANGTDGPMLPRMMILTIGLRDTLVIRNDDDFPARIGPFKLDSGQHYRQQFRTPGEIQLICSTMYHEEQVSIRVQPAPPDVWLWWHSLFR